MFFFNMSVRAMVGLGNPGPQYAGTRHNIGFEVVDALAAKQGVPWQTEKRWRAHTAPIVIAGQAVLLVKPQTFMNESGRCVSSVCRHFRWKVTDCVVVYDEYQIPVGQWKVSIGGGFGGHNGVADIATLLGAGFIRFRIGIGPAEKPLVSLTDFVLGRFTDPERDALTASQPKVLEGLEQIVREGPVRAMNTLNRKAKAKQPNPTKSDESENDEKLPRDGDPEHPGLHRAGGDPGRETE